MLIVSFALALVAYGIESIAWPLDYGRDGPTYLMYYADMWHEHPALPALMLFRTPLAPLVYGPLLQLGGPLLAEVGLALGYAVSVAAFAAAAAEFSVLAGAVTAVALLAYPGYGALFHVVSSDPIFAIVIALWTFVVVRALREPKTPRFVLAAFLFFCLVLARPGSQVLLLFALAPLLLGGAWRRKLVWSAAFLGVAGTLLVAWAGYNDARYGSFVVARAGWANLPFYRVFYMDKLVRSTNGPASRELADAIRLDLLPKAPYPQIGIKTPDQFFAIASDHMWGDVVVTVDRHWGWQSDYRILRSVSLEAIRRHLHLYVRDVALAVWDELRYPYQASAPRAASLTGSTLGSGQGTSSQAEANPGGRYWWLASTPNGLPPVASRVTRLRRALDRLQHGLPERSGSPRLAADLNRLSRGYPWPAIWLGVALLATLVRRPNGARILLIIAGLALAVIIETELGEPPVPEYGLPFVPVFVMCAIVSVVGRPTRRRVERADALTRPTVTT